MIKYFLGPILLSLLLTGVADAQKLTIGQWYAHLPHSVGRQVVDAGEEVYVLTNVYFFSFNKTSGEITRYDKVWGLSDVQVDHIAYSDQEDALIVAYRNTNIDLIKGGNTVINVSDILRKSISGIKEINAIVVKGNLAYIPTTFGLTVYDLEREEFRDTYIIGDNGGQTSVLDVAFTTDSIFALTAEGLKRAPLTGLNLANYQNWVTVDNTSGLPSTAGNGLEAIGDTLLVWMGNSVYAGTNGQYNLYYATTTHNINNIKVTGGELYILESDSTPIGRIAYREASTWAYINNPTLNMPMDITLDGQDRLWIAELFGGLVRIQNGNGEKITPNGPPSSSITGMAFANGTLWVAPGGVTPNWGYAFNSDGFLKLEDGFWNAENQFNNPAMQGVLNVIKAAVSPFDNSVYFGTYWDGLLKWDGTNLSKYSKNNSTLQGATGDTARTRVGGLAFDPAGNLWIANHGAASVLHVLATDGNFYRMNTPPITFGSASQIVVDEFNQIWVASPQSPSQGILVYDYGADVANTSDDTYKILTTQQGSGGLPSNEVQTIAMDKSGQIWVGTNQGIAVFYCAGSVFTQGCDAQRIIVNRDGFNGYLLETERVNDILIDGANRKWVATNNGVWVFSPDGTEELAYYNEDNSPLLSDNVLTLGYDGEQGIVYISTDKGLVSVRTEATEATNAFAETIEVFPNPVKETHTGPIAIRGLPANAEVRITDVTGMLIYQTQAFGGQAIWNGRDYTGRKAKTGVYLVFAINEDGSESKPTKLLFIK